MCPACFTTVALTVVGATSTGGLVALIVRWLPRRKGPKRSLHARGGRTPPPHVAAAAVVKRERAGDSNDTAPPPPSRGGRCLAARRSSA